MQITEVRYQRVKNLGNYETERCELVALVDEDENPKEVFVDLRDMAEEFLDLNEDENYHDYAEGD